MNSIKIDLRLGLNNLQGFVLWPFLLILTFASANAQGDQQLISWKQCLDQEAGWYASAEAIRIGDNLITYQHNTGGWPKNIDMAKMLSEEERSSILKEKDEDGTVLSRATLDNGATATQMRYLAKVYAETGLKRFRESFLQGLRYLLAAQYANGGWPQYYPIRKGYYEQITFNDDAMVNTMHLLKKVYSDSDEFASLQLSDEVKGKAHQSFGKGLQCILRTQIHVNGKLTVWCAQHDKVTLAPTKARSYELPSLSGSESVGIVLLLMSIDNPPDEVIAAVEGAVTWFEKSKIGGIRLDRITNEEGQEDRIVVPDSNAEPLWGRFYDLDTGEPFFCSRDGIKRNSLAEISYDRRNGYRWYTNAPAEILKEYPQWKEKVSGSGLTKPRVIISTDIGGTDPDDFQSMIHYLMYADRFDTEGILSSPSGDGRKEDILEMIDLYEQDFAKMKQHGDFPEPAFLRSVAKQGATSFAPPQGWSEQASEGSQWIVEKAKVGSDRPLWVLVWGGLEDVAQALHDAPEIESKIRVYWIGGPNKKWSVHPYLYLARNFPDLWMIEANSTYRGWFIDDGANEKFSNSGFYQSHIKDRGAMGSAFGNYYHGDIKMGDTPSVAYMLSGKTEEPEGESWGGSFIPLPYSAFRPFCRQTSLADTVPSYSVLEWTFVGGHSEDNAVESVIWMDIDNQRIDGFYEGDGKFKIRFVPKRADTWEYTVYSDITGLNGVRGKFVSANPYPGKDHPANIELNHWWSDRIEQNTYLGQYQGAKTVSRWREDFLSDWAVRFSWLEDD